MTAPTPVQRDAALRASEILTAMSTGNIEHAVDTFQDAIDDHTWGTLLAGIWTITGALGAQLEHNTGHTTQQTISQIIADLIVDSMT